MEVFILEFNSYYQLLRVFRGLIFIFHVDTDLDILFEKLTAQIVAWRHLGTQLPFETPGDIWVNIGKIQQLILGQ